MISCGRSWLLIGFPSHATVLRILSHSRRRIQTPCWYLLFTHFETFIKT